MEEKKIPPKNTIYDRTTVSVKTLDIFIACATALAIMLIAAGTLL
jgi:hypothetical protein